jgi:hypothetical protein
MQAHSNLRVNATAVATVMLAMQAAAHGSEPVLDRITLATAEPPRPTYSELDARNVKAPPHFDVKAPAGAPTADFSTYEAPAELATGAIERIAGARHD